MSDEMSNRLPAGMRNVRSEEKHRRIEATHTFEVQGHVDDVFGLFDPVSERDWVDDWDPQPVFPLELSRETGTVFTLVRDGRTAVWTVLRHDPKEHVAEYLAAEVGYLHRWIYVSCSALENENTAVTVRYVTTVLGEDGQKDLERYGKDFLLAWEGPVQTAINNLAA